jgi:ubiquinone/menaquinone biosynthesis C-methylase UbiE
MEFIDPEKILENLDLEPDMIAADFGCGSGGSTIPLAKKLYDGLVYAIDVQEGPLNALKGRTNAEGITNIRFIRADLEKDSKLSGASVNVVLIVNAIFQAEDKKAMLSEAKRVLKKKGILMVVDWLPRSGFKGIAQGRVTPDRLKKIAEEIGFSLKKEFEAGKYHFGLIFENK